MLVSARTGEGLEPVGERIEEEFERRLQDVELLLPYSEGGRLAELHEIAGDLVREDTPEGVRVSVRLPATVAARFQRYSANGNEEGRAREARLRSEDASQAAARDQRHTSS
jgi:GTP-binding protein HflX